MIRHLTKEEFDNEKKEYMLVDFYATWCGPCKMMASVLESVDSKNIIDIAKVNIDEERQLAIETGIEVIPTLLLFKEGKEIKRSSGFMTEQELIKWVSEDE